MHDREEIRPETVHVRLNDRQSGAHGECRIVGVAARPQNLETRGSAQRMGRCHGEPASTTGSFEDSSIQHAQGYQNVSAKRAGQGLEDSTPHGNGFPEIRETGRPAPRVGRGHSRRWSTMNRPAAPMARSWFARFVNPWPSSSKTMYSTSRPFARRRSTIWSDSALLTRGSFAP